MKGKLYLVATPIGNLEDITMRAVRILQEVDCIAAEDTRHTLKLLNHLNISKPLISYHRHNEEVRIEGLLTELEKGKNIAVVSDAGTPAISDPGEEIVKECIQREIEIIPIPGPCALITGLIASGLSTKEFIFFGFLPLNKKTRAEKLKEIQEETHTVILYEAPHKLQTTLKDLESILGDRKLVLAKELTKIHENFFRGTVKEVQAMVPEPKGEYVILIEGATKSIEDWSKLSIQEQYVMYQKQGLEKKEIIKQIAKNQKVPRNEIYKQFITVEDTEEKA